MPRQTIKRYFLKILLTLTFVFGGYLCFVFSEKISVQREIQVSKTLKMTTITEDDGLKKFLEYIGLFLLVVAAWQWSKEIGFDSFGFISKKPDFNPTDPSERDNDEGDTPPERTLPVIPDTGLVAQDDELTEFRISETRSAILELMRENPNSITNVTILANRLGLSRQTAERYLFKLMKEKLVRKDTYPGSRNSVYSLNNSLDNLAVDYFIRNHLKSEEVLGDYRFVKLKNKYEIDALIKTSKTNFIIETKFLSQISTSILNKGIQQLLRIEEEINLEPISLVLLVVGPLDLIPEEELKELLIKENLKIYLVAKDKITTPNT
jgi:DNA-binding transcriptional ArsR family regulator